MSFVDIKLPHRGQHTDQEHAMCQAARELEVATSALYAAVEAFGEKATAMQPWSHELLLPEAQEIIRDIAGVLTYSSARSPAVQGREG